MKYILLACMLSWNVLALCDSQNALGAPDTPYTRMLSQRARILGLQPITPITIPPYMIPLNKKLQTLTTKLKTILTLPTQTFTSATS